MDRQYSMEDRIPLYYEGLLSGEERTLVERWIHESEEHEKTARQIAMIYLAADTADVLKRTDADKAFQKVNSRIRLHRFGKLWVRLERAAVILLIPLLGYLYWDSAREKETASDRITVRCSPGSITTATLPDGTVACLNTGTTLTYPGRFDKDSRQVELNGEAYFEVAKEEGRHFLVHLMGGARIEVTGTRFNVKAYEGSHRIVTTLVEGKVRFHLPGKGNGRVVDLAPGDRLGYDTDDASLKMAHTDGRMETGWKDGRIIFEDTRLDEVVNILKERFNVDINLSGKTGPKMSFTGEFRNSRLEEILNCICHSSDLRWKYIPDSTGTKARSTYEIYR